MMLGTICLSEEKFMNIFKAYALISMQNHTKHEIKNIFETFENLKPQKFRRLMDKAIYKYGN